MQKDSPLCDPYAWEKPEILLTTGVLYSTRPGGACVSELINQVIIVYIIALLTGLILSGTSNKPALLWGTLSFATLYLVPAFWKILYPTTGSPTEIPSGKYKQVEGFQTEAPSKGFSVVQPIYGVIGSGGGAPALATLPTARNPFMNVLIDEIKYNPRRPEAVAINDPAMKIGLDDFFRTEFNRDPTDVFGRSQSQRQFVTMPSTSIPNDQGSFQDWLYKIEGKTCKEGGREACLPGTDGGALPWLNVSV
jgi:hypothetical protein